MCLCWGCGEGQRIEQGVRRPSPGTDFGMVPDGGDAQPEIVGRLDEGDVVGARRQELLVAEFAPRMGTLDSPPLPGHDLPEGVGLRSQPLGRRVAGELAAEQEAAGFCL